MSTWKLWRVRSIFFIPPLVYTGFLIHLSLVNLKDTPVKDLGVSDKLLHVTGYFVLGGLWMLFSLFGFEKTNIKGRTLIISGISIIFGIFIEVLQDTLTSYRQWDILDILANSIGVIVAGITFWSLKNYLIRLKAKFNLFFIKK